MSWADEEIKVSCSVCRGDGQGLQPNWVDASQPYPFDAITKESEIVRA